MSEEDLEARLRIRVEEMRASAKELRERQDHGPDGGQNMYEWGKQADLIDGEASRLEQILE